MGEAWGQMHEKVGDCLKKPFARSIGGRICDDGCSDGSEARGRK